MVCAWRLQGAKFVTVEAQAVSVALAKKTAKYNGIEDRYEIRSGDFRDPGVIAEDELFDLITGSPPYFPLDSGPISEHPQKQACRFEIRGTVADYILTASKHLALGGMFTLVFPIQPVHQEKRVLDGAKEAGMTIVRFRPVALKEGEPPLLGLFCMVKNEHLPERLRGGIMWKEPALTIRCKDGTVHPEYVAVKLSFGFPP
jgi:tRNA1(Val) A37 N6-methylase TrmN6